MGAVNIWQSNARAAGISVEQYSRCLAKATGCMELVSLTMECGQRAGSSAGGGATQGGRGGAYDSIKALAQRLCSGEHLDLTMGAINMWQTNARQAGIAADEYYRCLGKASGCMELTTLTMQCGQR